VDESDQHAGHAGSRMLGNTSGETHFRISVVSAAFDGLNTVKRHRMVYQVSTSVCMAGLGGGRGHFSWQTLAQMGLPSQSLHDA